MSTLRSTALSANVGAIVALMRCHSEGAGVLGSDSKRACVSALFYNGVPEAVRDVFRARLKARFAHLDDHLSSNEYLMGHDYSVADTHFFVVSNWAS